MGQSFISVIKYSTFPFLILPPPPHMFAPPHKETFVRTLKAAKAKNCSKANRILTLKFLLNMLVTESTRPLLTKSNFVSEIIVAAIEDADNFASVIDTTVACLMKYAQKSNFFANSFVTNL